MVGYFNLEFANTTSICVLVSKDKIQSKQNKKEKKYELQRTRVRKELGDTFELVEIGDAATFDGLTKELDTKERLDALIDKLSNDCCS